MIRPLFGLLVLAGCAAPAKVIDRAALSNPGALTVRVDYPGVLHGDSNCDGWVDFCDIDSFVAALIGWSAWNARLVSPYCHWYVSDCNGDGRVDFDDIGPFVKLLVQA